MFDIIDTIVAVAGKLFERPGSDACIAPAEIAKGDPVYGFTVKNAELLASRPIRVGHFARSRSLLEKGAMPIVRQENPGNRGKDRERIMLELLAPSGCQLRSP
jgi:hypothetical protein